MSTSATGRVLRSAGGPPWVGLTATATDVSAMLDDTLLDRRAALAVAPLVRIS